MKKKQLISRIVFWKYKLMVLPKENKQASCEQLCLFSQDKKKAKAWADKFMKKSENFWGVMRT